MTWCFNWESMSVNVVFLKTKCGMASEPCKH